MLHASNMWDMRVAWSFCIALLCFLVPTFASAGQLTYVRDLISTSVPGAAANQTITFRLSSAVPAGGAIVIDYDEGMTIPASGFTHLDMDLATAAVPGGPYTERGLNVIASPGSDGVSATTGVGGQIRIDMNTFTAIPAGHEVQIEIGTNASGGNTPLILSNATGSYAVTFQTRDATDVPVDSGETRIVVVDPVSVGPIDTTDTDPPNIVSVEPEGILQVGTRAVEMYLVTDELATCRYSTTSEPYASMPYSFSDASGGGSLTLEHFELLSGLTDDTTYTYYLSCADFRLNPIDPPYELIFIVGIEPGSATTTATSTEGLGEGALEPGQTEVASSTCVGDDCFGTGTGSGGGPSGSGSGDGPLGGDGPGSGSGGSGGDDSGTQLPQAGVQVSGWAYPGGTVSFVRDGVVVEEVRAGSDGSYEHTSEDLDRGSYTYRIGAADRNGVIGAAYTTTIWIQSETVNFLSNILLPPTISVPEASLDLGSDVAVSGYTVPDAPVTVWLRPRLAEVTSADIIATTTAGSDGAWALTVGTEGLARGTYELVAQSALPDLSVQSDKSARLTIGLGVEVANASCLTIGDLDCDGFVNLVDFSILLFNWNTSAEVADINGDGTVSLPDFSIMLFNWTG